MFPKMWYFYDHKGSSAGTFDSSKMFNTGLTLVAGRTYSITVNLNPAAGTSAASIDDGFSPIVSASNLGYRTGRGAAGSGPAYLHVSTNATSGTDNSAFSVDNVQIVPEPGSAFLGVARQAVLATRRRRTGA